MRAPWMRFIHQTCFCIAKRGKCYHRISATMRIYKQRDSFGNRKNQQEQKKRLISRVSVVLVLILAWFWYEEFLAIANGTVGTSSSVESHGATAQASQEKKAMASTTTTNPRSSSTTTEGVLGTSGSRTTSLSTTGINQQQPQKDLEKVGEEGGAWTAQTHLSHYGFNADWGLMEVIEDACREIENQHNPADEGWRQYENPDETNPIIGWWVAPKVVDCKVLEVGCGVGIYVDALKKEAAKRNRQVFGVEPNLMGGTFDRFNGPKQLAVNILEQADPIEFANKVRRENLRDTGNENDKYFDLIYSIEVFEHMPLERHDDVAKFLSGLARKGTKLIFGASAPGQKGTGHIGNRSKQEWEAILKKVGFVKDQAATIKAQRQMQEFNHKKNTQIYFYQG